MASFFFQRNRSRQNEVPKILKRVEGSLVTHTKVGHFLYLKKYRLFFMFPDFRRKCNWHSFEDGADVSLRSHGWADALGFKVLNPGDGFDSFILRCIRLPTFDASGSLSSAGGRVFRSLLLHSQLF